MSNSTAGSALAATQAPLVEVRDHRGELIGTIERSQASELLARGWAVAVGRRVTRYLKLKPDAPWRPSTGSWRGGSHTTRPVRGDGSCKSFGDGQYMGDWRLVREHKPTVR